MVRTAGSRLLRVVEMALRLKHVVVVVAGLGVVGTLACAAVVVWSGKAAVESSP